MSKLKKKWGKRVMAYILSGAMIMSCMPQAGMTAYATEVSTDTEGGYLEEAETDAKETEVSENETEKAVEAETTEETLENETEKTVEAQTTAEASEEETTEAESVEEETEDAQTSETEEAERTGEKETKASEKEEKNEDVRDDENTKTTAWDFSSSDFEGTSPYNGLEFTNGKKNGNYLLASANSTITVPISDTTKEGKVVVKACYGYAFKFESDEKIASASGSTGNVDTFEYYYKKGTESVTINVSGSSYFNSITIDTDNTTIADTTEWDFTKHEASVGTAITEWNGLIISGGKKHSNYGLQINSGSIMVPVNGKCMISVDAGYTWNIGFFNQDNINEQTSNDGDKTITYRYNGGKGMVPIIVGTSPASYIKKISITYIDEVTVSGTVTPDPSIESEYKVVFTQKDDDSQVIEADVDSTGKYSVALEADTTYTISLSDNTYSITEPEGAELEVGTEAATCDIKASALELVSVSGKIVADDVTLPGDLALTFTEKNAESAHTAKATITTADNGTTYTVELKKNTSYNVEAAGTGIKDFKLDTEEVAGKDADASDVDFTFTAKEKYAVTLSYESYDYNEGYGLDLSDKTIKFTDADDEDYSYTFTGTKGIKLRDGKYSVAVEGIDYPYMRTLDSYENLTVNGEAAEYSIKFVERMEWDFTAKDPALTAETYQSDSNDHTYNGLVINPNGSGKFGVRISNGDVQINANTIVKIPVSGKGTVKLFTKNTDHESNYYTVGTTGNTNHEQSWSYEMDGDGDDDYLTFQVTEAKTYLTKIIVTRESDDTEDTTEYRTSWDFTNNDNDEWTGIAFENRLGRVYKEKGGTDNDTSLLVNASAGKFAYDSAKGRVQVNATTGILVPVAGDSKITVKISSDPSETNAYVVGENKTAATGKEQTFVVKGNDIHSGSTGLKQIEITVTKGTIYIYSIIVEPLADDTENDDDSNYPSIYIKGKNENGLPDVWDFAAGATELDANGKPTKYIDSSKYNNMLTEDIMNSWYGDGVAAGTSGKDIGSFEVKNADDKLLLEFNGNGNGKANNRIRTKNKLITRRDEKSLTDKGGNEYLGYVYSNSASTPAVYLGIMLEAGDVVTAVVSSNGGDSTINFVDVDGAEDAQTYEYKTGNAGIATFYAKKTGEYKMYSVNEKLVVARVTVEKKEYVKVTGTVTAPETLKSYSIQFTNRESGAVTTAKVTNGKYTCYLNEDYTYDVALSNANGYVVKNDTPYFTLSDDKVNTTDDGKTFSYDVTIEAVDLVTVTGNVKGLSAVAGGVKFPLQSLKLGFESDNIYVPELKLNTATGTFTLTLEKGVEYKVTAEGVDDFTLNTTEISASEDGTKDIEFTAKPVYKITIEPQGVTAETLASTSFIFSRVDIEDDVKVYDEDYVYTFTGTEGITLRDGQYEISVGADCPYAMKATSDLKVDGKDVNKVIKFDSTPKTSWDFRESSYTGQESYGGLKITGGKKKDAQYGMQIKNGTVEIPVSGACTITVSVVYNWDIGMEGSETKYTDKTNSGDKDVTFEYTGNAGKAVITAGNDFTSYIKKISVHAEAVKDDYKSTLSVGASGCDYTSINDALAAVANMDRTSDQRVIIEIQPGDYEEMLVIDVPNVTLKNASEKPSIATKDKGVNIDENAVRITSYYGHGYAYYSMGSDCKWDADLLAANKENGAYSFENPGSGTTNGSYWNATVVIGADGFEADGIIFENSFNQYVSKKAADDVIVALSGAKEGSAKRASMKAGDVTVQQKEYVERAAALAIENNIKNVSFNNCKFIGRQDTLYGGTDVTAAFYDCAVYGGTDYIFGEMTAVFAKCDLVFNTNDQTKNGKNNDVGYITASKTASGRGYLMYNCTVTSTVPGVDTASEKTSKPGYFGRPWAANTGEALFYKTIIEATDYSGESQSLILPAGWNDGLSGKSVLSQEYASIEKAGVDNSANRVSWSSVLKADNDGNVKLADGNTTVTDDTVVKAFLGEWDAFAGKNMTISDGSEEKPGDGDSEETPGDGNDGNNPDKPEVPVVRTIKLSDCTIAVASIVADSKKNPTNATNVSVVYYTDKDSDGNPINPVRFAQGLDYSVSTPVLKEGTENVYTVTIAGLGRAVDNYKLDTESTVTKEYRVFDKKNNKDDIIDLSKAKLTLDASAKTAVYTGYGITPAVTEVKVGKDVIDASKYKVSYKSNVNAGKATVIVTADSDAQYNEGEKFVIGSKEITFTIKKATINKNITVEALDANGKTFGSEAYAYRGDGVEITTLTVKSSADKVLNENTDYTVTYKNNTKAGKATVTIKGIGNNVSGSYAIAFNINPLNIEDYTVDTTGRCLEYSPNGAKLMYITLRSETDETDVIHLTEDVDFKVTYKYADKNKSAGTKVDYTIKGINACKGSYSGTGEIKKVYFNQTVNIAGDIVADATKSVPTGAKLKKALEKSTVIVGWPWAGKPWKLNKHYTLEVTTLNDRPAVKISPAAAIADNYYEEGNSQSWYYFTAKNVAKLKIGFAKDKVFYYDGRNPVELTAADIAELGFKLNEDVRIVEGSYKNNFKAGTASVTIKGIIDNNYYGTKTIKFKIAEAK